MDTTITDGQLAKVMQTLKQKGMTPQRFNQLLSSGIFADVCDPNVRFDQRTAVRRALGLYVVPPEHFTLTVDYDLSRAQMIAAPAFDWVNTDVNEKNFPIVGKGVQQLEAKLFKFDDDDLTTQGMVDAIKSDDRTTPWEPGKLEHLLALAEQYPDEQRNHPIAALGSVRWTPSLTHMAPHLDCRGNARDLRLYGCDHATPAEDWSYLAVRDLYSTASP